MTKYVPNMPANLTEYYNQYFKVKAMTKWGPARWTHCRQTHWTFQKYPLYQLITVTPTINKANLKDIPAQLTVSRDNIPTNNLFNLSNKKSSKMIDYVHNIPANSNTL